MDFVLAALEDCIVLHIAKVALYAKNNHHTSICDRPDYQLMAASYIANKSVCYPVLVVEVNGIKMSRIGRH